MRLVFAGTPEAALPSLLALLDSHHEIAAVVTRPDAPAGRGRVLTPSPIAALALERGLPVLRPTSPKDPQFLAELADLKPDACPVVAYGGLVPADVLAVPQHGWINLHFSLLPAWRGAAPVQHAIWHGDQITGASTFRLETGLDTGPVFGVVTQTIKPTDTGGTLLAELADSGAVLLCKTLDGIESGELVPVAQPLDGVSLAPKITVDMARIDWQLPGQAIDRMIRACTPAPGAWCEFRGERLKVSQVSPVRPVIADGDDAADSLQPGELRVSKRSVLVGTATCAVELSTVRAQGKKEMPATDWARGLRIEPGESLS